MELKFVLAFRIALIFCVFFPAIDCSGQIIVDTITVMHSKYNELEQGLKLNYYLINERQTIPFKSKNPNRELFLNQRSR